eukprot:3292412-Pleurochrysis_carterae.AAC.1
MVLIACDRPCKRKEVLLPMGCRNRKSLSYVAKAGGGWPPGRGVVRRRVPRAARVCRSVR